MNGAIGTSLAHLSKILSGFILIKLISLYLGPSGLGALGNFMSAATIIVFLAGGGITTGVIKYVAEYKSKEKLLTNFIYSSIQYSFLCSILISVAGLLFLREITFALFGRDEYTILVVILLFSQLLLAFTNLVIAVCNGLHCTSIFAKIQLIGNIIFLPLSWFLIKNYSIFGASLAVVLMIIGAFFPAVYFYIKSEYNNTISESWKDFKRKKSIDKNNWKKLSLYSLMLITSSLAFPLVEIIVRNYIIQQSGFENAGLWQASVKLSAAYLGFFSLFLAYYFMPLVSAENETKNILKLVKKYLIAVGSICLIAIAFIYLLRRLIIEILFTNEFIYLEEMILYQLVGDFFKIMSYVIGFVAVAKAATRIYIAAEVLQASLFLGFIFLLSNENSLDKVFQSYLLANVCYFLICIFGFLVFMRLSIRKKMD